MHIGYDKGSVDEEFSGRIKDFEDKLKGTTSSEKKPRDLLRAIGLYTFNFFHLLSSFSRYFNIAEFIKKEELEKLIQF